MTVGEVIAAVCKYASDYDGWSNIMAISIYGIEVNGDSIDIVCTDSNTGTITINAGGADGE